MATAHIIRSFNKSGMRFFSVLHSVEGIPERTREWHNRWW